MFKLGVDIGGTFTDLVLADLATGQRWHEKVLTTPDDPSRGAVVGVERVLRAADLPASAVAQVIHGTTLVINAIIERKGARAGLLTTAGFRDVLEMRRGKRFDMDDLGLEVPDPLIPRDRVMEVPERVNRDGAVLVPLSEPAAREAVRRLLDAGVEAIAVSFLHAFRNQAHERRVGELIAGMAPDVDVSLSSAVAPDIGEYERTCTTAANAYTQPLVRRYLAGMARRLQEAGYRGNLYLMQSDAGLTTAPVASRFPIRLLESGPAGGAVAVRHVARRLGRPHLVGFDMGGTTAKICLITGGEIATAAELEVARRYRFKRGSGLPIRVPVVQLMEIGAGGGSIARIDDLGLIRVGPDSAGAAPGPACYGRGGQEPTVTDACLVLGYLNPDYFLGGEMRLEPDAARATLHRLAGPLGMDLHRVAWGLYEIVTEDMARSALLHLLDQGVDPRRFALLAFGGAGPLFACRLARKLGMREVLVPPGAGVASAFGFLAAPVAFTLVQGYVRELGQVDLDHVRALFAHLEDLGRQLLDRAGIRPEEVRLRRQATLRYRNQGSELTVPLPEGPLSPGALADLAARFHETFLRVYGRQNPQIPVEALSWQVVASGPEPDLPLAPRSGTGAPAAGRPPEPRPAYFPEAGGLVTCPVHRRAQLQPGAWLAGPAIIEERESTTVIPPGARVTVDGEGNLHVLLVEP